MTDIVDLTVQLTSFKNVLKGMYASWKTSVGELDKALKGFKLANDASVKDAQKAKKRASDKVAQAGVAGAGGKRKKGGTLIDVCLEKGVAATSFDSKVADWSKQSGLAAELFNDDANIKCMDPFVVTGVDIITWNTDENMVGKSFKDVTVV